MRKGVDEKGVGEKGRLMAKGFERRRERRRESFWDSFGVLFDNMGS